MGNSNNIDLCNLRTMLRLKVDDWILMQYHAGLLDDIDQKKKQLKRKRTELTRVKAVMELWAIVELEEAMRNIISNGVEIQENDDD